MRVLLRSIRGSEEVSHHPWDPMDPPEVGPIRYPGMPGRVEVQGLCHPVIPSGRPCALFPAKRYCVRSYILPLRGGLPGYASWCALGTLARYLVGNYTPPTIVATGSPVLGILPSSSAT